MLSVVLDHTALLVLGAGSRMLSGLVSQAHVRPGRYAAAATVGSFIAAGMDWRAAQAIDAGRPTAEWPSGRPVITTTPGPYSNSGVEIITAM